MSAAKQNCGTSKRIRRRWVDLRGKTQIQSVLGTTTAQRFQSLLRPWSYQWLCGITPPQLVELVSSQAFWALSHLRSKDRYRCRRSPSAHLFALELPLTQPVFQRGFFAFWFDRERRRSPPLSFSLEVEQSLVDIRLEFDVFVQQFWPKIYALSRHQSWQLYSAVLTQANS